MGLLVVGTPLAWEDALPYLKYVREHGIAQFLHTYNRVKDLSGDVLKWGDELEYGIFQVDPEKKTVKLSLRGSEVMHQLEEKEAEFGRDDNIQEACHWVPEYGAWMIEATPKGPYGGYTSDLRRVETNMRLRRARLLGALKPNEVAPTITCFPLLGVPDSSDKEALPMNGPVAMSSYISDQIINPHPRFGTLTANIRKRRGAKVDIRVPIYHDLHTKMHANEAEIQHPSKKRKWRAENARKEVHDSVVTNGTKTPISTRENIQRKLSSDVMDEPYPGFIHMDAMAFGMGMCCLQVTFQAKNIGESRHLYDHLGVLSPIFLALTAATPVLKGKLADTDVRWATIAGSVDDRTDAERGDLSAKIDPKFEHYAGNGQKHLPKSRYEGISAYICNHKHGNDPRASLDMYNDVPIPIDSYSFEKLTSEGVDESLARHIAHLFIRDPLVIYKEKVELDDTKETDHFENIQSTNWQTVRWKPPPPSSSNVSSQHQDTDSSKSPPESPSKRNGKPSDHVGWRTEFRSMEIQLTDFENAAFTVFIVLVSRVILAFDLNLYIPISKVDENMEIAHRRNAAVEEKFFFRSHLAPPENQDCPKHKQPSTSSEDGCCEVHDNPNRYEMMSIKEILLGKGSYYPGLLPLVYAYLDHIDCDDSTKEVVQKYLTLIEKRAQGELLTNATWMRSFVRSHLKYQHDSIVSSEIAYDLIQECKMIGEGLKECPEVLGDVKIEPIKNSRTYDTPLASTEVATSKRGELLKRYTQRSVNSCGGEE